MYVSVFIYFVSLFSLLIMLALLQNETLKSMFRISKTKKDSIYNIIIRLIYYIKRFCKKYWKHNIIQVKKK